jgi:hypothetical protein
VQKGGYIYQLLQETSARWCAVCMRCTKLMLEAFRNAVTSVDSSCQLLLVVANLPCALVPTATITSTHPKHPSTVADETIGGMASSSPCN